MKTDWLTELYQPRLRTNSEDRRTLAHMCICENDQQDAHFFLINLFQLNHPLHIPIYEYIQKDATLHSLFISGNCSTCFGWYLHPSSGVHTTVSTASGTCQALTATCRYRGRVGRRYRPKHVEQFPDINKLMKFNICGSEHHAL